MMEGKGLSYGLILCGLIVLSLIFIYTPIGFGQWFIALSIMSLCLGIGGFGLSINYKAELTNKKPNDEGVK